MPPLQEEQNKDLSVSNLQILKVFGIEIGTIDVSSNKQQQEGTAMNTWTPPPTGFLKLNFDGASQGNLRPAGIGGVLRDSKGEIQHIFSQSLGEGTNNKMEFAALEQGL